MANHALPTTSSLYTDVLTNLKDRIDDSVKMMDSANTSPTNIPTNAIRWNSTTTLWEKYSGSAWGSLAASYAIQVLKSSNLVGGNSTTLLGSIPYQSNTNTTSLLSPNTTTTRKFLRQTGTGTNGAVPVWDTILAADVPTLNQNTTGSAATLTTARTINGVSFNGSANINIEDRLGTPIASASTTTIGTAGLGDYIHITGTTTITSFGTASTAGTRRTLIFDGALTITHNATSLICVGGTSIVTVAGTVIEVVAETTANWRVVSITHPAIDFTELGYLNGVTSAIQTQINAKQATLVSGTNIKTINSNSILGSGNLVVTAPSASQTAQGIIAIATDAGVQAGTDTTRAVTPAGLKASLPSLIAGATNSGIGDFALCKSEVVVSYGNTVAGSSLVTTGIYALHDADGSWTLTNGSSLSGTWQCKGTIGKGRGFTLFKRIA